MPPGAKALGRQFGACKNFTTKVKNRSQARLQRRQILSHSNRLVRAVEEGGVEVDTGQNGSGVVSGAAWGTRPGAHQEVLFILFF